jgi:predicted alpha/beta superfamily hydrolase
MKIFVFSLTVLLLFSTNAKSQTTASKQVSTFTIEAPQLNIHKKIWMYLPKSYKTSKKSYPVIYMHDAQNLFDTETSYVGEWKIDEYLDTISNKEVIIIGIEHGNEKRVDELTPFKNEKYGGGQGDNYLAFIKNTLKPYTDITYRTLRDVKNTAIFGSSLGGLISFFAVIKYPETFGSAGVFSPSFWINKEMFELVKTTKINPTTKFFFLVGSKEGDSIVQDQNNMVALLIEKGVVEKHIINKVINGGKHNEAFWSKYFPEAHQWLFQE